MWLVVAILDSAELANIFERMGLEGHKSDKVIAKERFSHLVISNTL